MKTLLFSSWLLKSTFHPSTRLRTNGGSFEIIEKFLWLLSVGFNNDSFQKEGEMDAFNSKMVSRIVGVSLRQIQYWDERGFIRPSVRLAEGRGSKRLYSFSDLIQLKVVKDLTRRGLSLRKVRRCLSHLKHSFPGAAQPPDSLRYLTDGEKLFILTSDREKILDVMERQFIFSLGIGNLVRELNGEVRRVAGRRGARAGGDRHRPEDKREGSA